MCFLFSQDIIKANFCIKEMFYPKNVFQWKHFMHFLLFDTKIIRIYNSNNHISMIKWSQEEREEQKERNTTLTTTTNQLLLPSSSSLNSTKIIYQQTHLSLPSYSHPFTPSPPPHIHTLHCPDSPRHLSDPRWHCESTKCSRFRYFLRQLHKSVRYCFSV